MTHKTPFVVHGIAPEGVEIVVTAPTPFTSSSMLLLPGETLEITQQLLELNTPRNGSDSFLLMTAAEQTARWGHPLFGIGSEIPDHVVAYTERQRRDRLRDEANSIRKMNPTVARATAAAARLAAINEELSA